MLRDYQLDLFNKTRLSMANGHKHICIVAPCGAGKSYIIDEIIKNAGIKNNQVLLLVHRIELKDQLDSLFNYANCQTALYQTATRHIDKIIPPKIIICDESHLSLNPSYYRIFDSFPNSYIIGTTATPVKLNYGGLGAVYDDLVIGVNTKWLIANNYLSNYVLYSKPLINRSELEKDYTGEYKTIYSPKIYGDVIENYKKLADGKKTIVFASSIAHSKEVCEAFNQAGYKAAHLDGDVNKTDRKRIIEDFRDGKINILCNFLIVAEGLSVDDCECCILLKATASLSRYLQSAMRCMRYRPGKTAIIIDHCQNYLEHGLPDEDREWSLESKHHKISLENNELKIRECKNCLRVYQGSNQECPYCHYINAKPKKQLEIERKQELEEIKHEQIIKAKREVGMCRSLESLITLAKKRGYKNPLYWANTILKARNNKNNKI